MRKTIRLIIAILGGLVATPACKTLPPVVARTIDCAKEVAGKDWPIALAPINKCLGDAQVTDPNGCLLGLVQPGAVVTADLVACLVREQGSHAAHAAMANANDTISVRSTERARAFIESQRVTFKE